YSLLRAAVRIAARFGLAMERLLDMAQLAYFEEHRRRAPRDLAQVARQLDLSVRTTGTLHRRFKSDFFAAEREVEPVRRATAVLLKGERTAEQVCAALRDLEREQVARALRFLVDSGWASEKDGRFRLGTGVRSFVSDELVRRID